MSVVQQGPTPAASATVRGLVGLGAQTFTGPKTFANKVTISAQGGIALDLGANDSLGWADGNTLGVFGGNIYAPSGGFRTQQPAGYAMGGVNSAFSSGGLRALAQSYLADVIQGQAIRLSLISGKGASAGVVVKVGTSEAAPDAGAELLRVGYGMGDSTGSDGTPVLQAFADGHLELPVNTANAYIWIKSGNGVYLNGAGTKRIYFDGTDIATNGNTKVYGVLATTSNVTCGNDLTLNSSNAIIWGGSMGVYGTTNGDFHIYGGTSGTLALDNYTNDSANAGARTVNKARGKNAFAAGAAAVTITNNLVTVESQVVCTLEQADATLTQILRCIPAAGSFTVTGNANATAATKFSWFILK